MIHKAAHDSKYGKEIKKLITKKILQRLPISLPHVNAGNASENFTN